MRALVEREFRLPQRKALPTPEMATVMVAGGDIKDARGEVIHCALEPGDDVVLDLTDITNARALVITGIGATIRKIYVSERTCPFVVYDATITSEGVSQAAIEGVEAPAPDWDLNNAKALDESKVNRLAAFVNCHFEATDRHRRVYPPAGVDIPGITDDRVGPKWWASAKCPRDWVFYGCTFTACQETHLYLPWPDGVDVRYCTFYASGGTHVQIVHRFGKPNDQDPRYYGNPAYPARRGKAVFAHNRHIDHDIWGREASCITGAGQGFLDWWIVGSSFSGSSGAIALWADEHKGVTASLGNFATTFVENVDFEHGAMGLEDVPSDDDWWYGTPDRVGVGPPDSQPWAAHGKVVLDRLFVAHSENHNRVQVAISGARELYSRRLQIDTYKPAYAVDTEGGGAFKTGEIYHDGSEVLKTWTGHGYSEVADYNPIR